MLRGKRGMKKRWCEGKWEELGVTGTMLGPTETMLGATEGNWDHTGWNWE